MDLVLRECATNSKNLVPGGRSFFSPNLGNKDLGGGLVAWQGFYMSIRPAQDNLLVLNIDMTGNAFIKEGQTLVEFVSRSFGADPRDLDRNMRRQDAQGDTYRVKMKKLVKGLKVETSHCKTKRKLKIVSLTRQPLETLNFNMNGMQVSVADYFRQTYGLNLAFGGFPAVEQGSGDRKKYIPLELCRLVKGQNFTRRVNDDQRKGLSAMTCCLPEQRVNATQQACLNLKKQSEDHAKEFGVEINPNWTRVPARVLNPPKVKYGNGEICPRDGTWNMINKKMVEGREIKHWGIISCSNRVRENDLQRIAQQLSSACLSYGVGLDVNVVMPPLVVTVPQTVDEAIRSSVKKLAERNIELQLLVCILPDREHKPFYVTIKRLCELELGVITQCAQEGKIRKCDPRYLANLILKINAKFGGKNAVICAQDLKKCKPVADSPTLIIGADVSHPRAGEETGCSMAAVVASMDWPGFAQYATVVRSQPSRQEMLDDLFWENVDEQGRSVSGGIFKEMLMAFHHRTNFIPERIIYYRDGVSEGQFEAVLRSEYESLQRACSALGWSGGPPEQAEKRSKQPSKGPKITFIVVQKRHHTCFFPATKPTGKNQNISPGTIVDKVVCHPTNFDFYLCSHQGIKGTSRPVHYHVLKDENGFTANEIQQFTHDLCYLYSRCTRAVSYVPPCYYAHLAAQRAQAWVDPEGSTPPTTASGGGSDAGGGPAGGSRGGRRAARRVPSGPVRPLPPMHEKIRNTMFYI
ncbi:protein argonaute 1B [Selaginella moellendorffii]|uniref:protein argonaute 1B n=1 Tax=Selaginella moellendorffii TaxID=88036 RepID=UPI000D1CCC3D|nr:protein argonaute 1B [Selaginella moellendorffii]|eukprot:XP_024535988.1 protein argonaute 1B [Selaginella moellendorffii]